MAATLYSDDGGVPIRKRPSWDSLRGQVHHPISRDVHDALQDHRRLQNIYEYRDSRFVAKRLDVDSHRYDAFHRRIDRELANEIRANPNWGPDSLRIDLTKSIVAHL